MEVKIVCDKSSKNYFILVYLMLILTIIILIMLKNAL